jgi:hypothetical protein
MPNKRPTPSSWTSRYLLFSEIAAHAYLCYPFYRALSAIFSAVSLGAEIKNLFIEKSAEIDKRFGEDTIEGFEQDEPGRRQQIC